MSEAAQMPPLAGDRAAPATPVGRALVRVTASGSGPTWRPLAPDWPRNFEFGEAHAALRSPAPSD